MPPLSMGLSVEDLVARRSMFHQCPLFLHPKIPVLRHDISNRGLDPSTVLVHYCKLRNITSICSGFLYRRSKKIDVRVARALKAPA
jgi:hypothetical protein